MTGEIGPTKATPDNAQAWQKTRMEKSARTHFKTPAGTYTPAGDLPERLVNAQAFGRDSGHGIELGGGTGEGLPVPPANAQPLGPNRKGERRPMSGGKIAVSARGAHWTLRHCWPFRARVIVALSTPKVLAKAARGNREARISRTAATLNFANPFASPMATIVGRTVRPFLCRSRELSAPVPRKR